MEVIRLDEGPALKAGRVVRLWGFKSLGFRLVIGRLASELGLSPCSLAGGFDSRETITFWKV